MTCTTSNIVPLSAIEYFVLLLTIIHQIHEFFIEEKHIADTRTWVGWIQILTVAFVLNWCVWFGGTIYNIWIHSDVPLHKHKDRLHVSCLDTEWCVKSRRGIRWYWDSLFKREAHSHLPVLVFIALSGGATSFIHMIIFGMEMFIQHEGSTPSSKIAILFVGHTILWGCEVVLSLDVDLGFVYSRWKIKIIYSLLQSKGLNLSPEQQTFLQQQLPVNVQQSRSIPLHVYESQKFKPP
ncbi:MAG: hypothetical protein ACTSUE_13740 [Promethearchaeota archaeon]